MIKLIELSIQILFASQLTYAMCPGLAGDPRCYQVENGNVYYRGGDSPSTFPEVQIKGADADTFREFSGKTEEKPGAPHICRCPIYAKDKNGVYLKGVKLNNPQPDLKTFRFLGDSYTVDKTHVFYEGKVFEGLNPDTFHLEGWFWQDSDTVIIGKNHILIPKAKFKAYGDPTPYVSDGVKVYSSIKCGIYSCDYPIEGADPKTFKLLQDRTGKYSLYAVDNHAAYFCCSKIEGMPDLATLHVDNAYLAEACDKKGCWSYGRTSHSHK